MFWKHVKAGAVVLYRSFIAGAIGGASAYVTHRRWSAGRFTPPAIGDRLRRRSAADSPPSATVVEQWFDPRRRRLESGRGSAQLLRGADASREAAQGQKCADVRLTQGSGCEAQDQSAAGLHVPEQ